jgi:MATE family multidrug resistance protein
MDVKKFWQTARPTLSLALPIMAGQVSQMLMGIIDSAMLGKIGVVELAAAAFANNMIAFPFVFGIGLLTAISVRVSQAYGANEHHQIGEVLRHGLALALFAGVLLFLAIFGASFFLDKFGQEAQVARESRGFFLLLGLSMIPMLLAFALKNLCESLGKPWIPTIVLLLAVPLNVVLNWIFIYGNLGSPRLEIEGAGLATLLARIGALVGVVFFVARNQSIRNYLKGLKLFAPLQLPVLKDMLQIGVPTALQISIEVAAFSAGAIIVGMISAPALAAHQIALSCAATTFMLPLGLSAATTIRVGNAVGARNMESVRAIGFNSMVLGVGVMAVTALVFFFFGEHLASLFVKANEEGKAVAKIAASLLMIAAIFQLADGLQIVSAGALRGLSDATIPMICTIVSYWLIGLPCGYFLAFNQNMGASGIWSGFAIGLAISAIFLSWRFSEKTRRRFQLQGS